MQHRPTPDPVAPTRRVLLRASLGLTAAWMTGTAQAANQLDEAVMAFTAGVVPQQGRVHFQVASLVDNGNTVPMTIRVDSPMTAADHVRTIAVFNERNPQPDVIRVELGPDSGKAQFSTRMRLATSQRLCAVARMSDGSFWQHSVDVIVTIAACIEDPS
jgi:sulfur-oxidizing protein SoxY